MRGGQEDRRMDGGAGPRGYPVGLGHTPSGTLHPSPFTLHPRVSGYQGIRVSLGVSGTSIGYQYRVGKAMGRQWEGNRQWEGEGQRGVFNYNKINNYSIKVVMMSIAGLILIKF